MENHIQMTKKKKKHSNTKLEKKKSLAELCTSVTDHQFYVLKLKYTWCSEKEHDTELFINNLIYRKGILN